jgi:hemerythrin-like domain-containing protein
MTSTPVTQVTLPGQTYTADGPYDQLGMYVMHHAFRRDLANFVAAVHKTPIDDGATWTALAARWARFDEVLHHHHQIEDTSIWPALLAHADASASAEDRATLEAMAAEHATIDPALQTCRRGFAEMLAHPSEGHRSALEAGVAALGQALAEHLRHEETDALPLLQRTMTPEEWGAAEKAAQKGYPPRLIPFLVPWALDRLPEEAAERLIRDAGRIYGVIHRLTRRGYERRESRAFRHVSGGR